MKIICPSCGRTVTAADIDLKGRLAKCSSCNNVFSFDDHADAGYGGEREKIGMPGGISVERTMQGVRIVRRWFGSIAVFLAFFCLFWDGFMAFWFITAFRQGQLAMAAFGSIHALVGVGLTYFCVASFINRTCIDITYGQIIIAHKPLPWTGNKIISASDIKQLYSKEKVHHGRNGGHYSYEVHAQTLSAQSIVVLTGLTTSEQALFIEQTIEEHLRIEDRAVRGEILR